MKKTITLILLTAILVSLAACFPIGQASGGVTDETWIAYQNTVVATFNLTGAPEGDAIFTLLRVPLKATWLADEITAASLFVKPIGTAPSKLRVGTTAQPWATNATAAEARSVVDEGSLNSYPLTAEADGWVSIDVTAIVKGWLSREVNNNGFALFAEPGEPMLTFSSDDDLDGPQTFAYLKVSGVEGDRPLTYGKFGYTQQPADGEPTDSGGNCMSYALRDTHMILENSLKIDSDRLNELYMQGGADATADYIDELVLAYVAKHAEDLQISGIRKLESYDAPIDIAKEYRIAMRTGCRVDDETSIDLGGHENFDYHFWVQLNDGRWAQKFPLDPSEIIPGTGPGIDPGRYQWNSTISWYDMGSHGYYTSKITYYAITKDTDAFTAHDLYEGLNALGSPDMVYELADASGIVVREYDFGEGDLVNSAGKAVPCPINGIIAAPDTDGAHPLVVIFHGVRPIDSVYSKEFSGFDYLVQQLADEGYVAVSFNVNVEYSSDYGESVNSEWAKSIYKQNLAYLEKANAGTITIDGLDLKGKIDFDNINMMGHSNGADLAESIIRMEQDEGLDRFKTFIRLAGTHSIYETPQPDIPTGFIICEYDGDVPEDGQAAFDMIQGDSTRTAPASLVFLRGGNHAFFNHAFKEKEEADFGLKPMEGSEPLTRDEQERFVKTFAAAFLSVFEKGEPPFGMWDSSVPEPFAIADCRVTASNYIPGRRALLTAEANDATDWTLTPGIIVTQLTLEGGYGNGILFTYPGATLGSKTPALFNLRWKRESSITIPLSGDFTPFKALDLFVAVDSSDPINPIGEGQSFIVTLRDTKGRERSVDVPFWSSALSYYPGYKEHYDATEFSPEFEVWIGSMPLGDLRIPLTLFDGLDLSQVTAMRVEFGNTEAGSIMLSGIYLTH
ncbi:hypothetical protein AGMMS49992_16180 [Clostridia bacterium]|nr:hypothetical protein AGMMS49992_16180 [Clostridia bacterium]